MPVDYSSRIYKRSRFAYTAQCVFEYLVQLLATDAFLAKLLIELGLSDGMIGIVSTLVSSAFLVELLAIVLIRRVHSMKTTVVVFDTLSIAFFAAAYALPLLNISQGLRTALAFLCIGGGFLLKYVVYSMYFVWANSFVHPDRRGRYSAVKEMVSLAAGIAFSLCAGLLFDRYEQSGNLKGCFTLISVLVLGINVICFIFMMMIGKEPESAREKSNSTVREIAKATLGNKRFMYSVLMICLWRFAQYLTVGFLGTFRTNELAMSVTTIQIINTLGSVSWFVLSMPFGKYADKTSYTKAICVAMMVAAAGFAANCFTTPSAWWMIIVYTVLYNISVAGTGQNAINITYSYVDQKYLVQAMAIKDSLEGVVALVASLAGSRILSAVQAHGNKVLGIPMYGQQLLSLLSLLVVLGTVVYTKLVVEKQQIDKK